MSSIVVSGIKPGAVPKESGYTHGFLLLTAAAVVATLAGFLVPNVTRSPATTPEDLAVDERDLTPHAELGLVAAGTLVGDLSE